MPTQTPLFPQGVTPPFVLYQGYLRDNKTALDTGLHNESDNGDDGHEHGHPGPFHYHELSEDEEAARAGPKEFKDEGHHHGTVRSNWDTVKLCGAEFI